jgi:phenylacetate-coenzyme A ligase PaaK-like adenylate-forming protein
MSPNSNKPQLEKSTITLPTAIVVIGLIVGGVANFFAMRYAIQLENQALLYKIEAESQKRQSEDEKLEMKIVANREAIEAVSTKVELIQKAPTFRFR